MRRKNGKFFVKFWIRSGAKECRSCRARKMLKNAPTLAIVAVHTEENEPSRVLIRNTNIEYRWYLYSLFYTQSPLETPPGSSSCTAAPPPEARSFSWKIRLRTNAATVAMALTGCRISRFSKWKCKIQAKYENTRIQANVKIVLHQNLEHFSKMSKCWCEGFVHFLGFWGKFCVFACTRLKNAETCRLGR